MSELKKLRARTIITSPPYLDTQDYGVPRQIGFGQQQEEYFADIRSVFEQCRELSTDDATLWLVVGSVHRAGRLVQLPEILANLAAEAGWIPREQITWAKGKSLPWAGSGGFRDVSDSGVRLLRRPGCSSCSRLCAGRWGCVQWRPPKRALPIEQSADCHSQFTPPNSWHSSIRTAQMASSAPHSTQRWC